MLKKLIIDGTNYFNLKQNRDELDPLSANERDPLSAYELLTLSHMKNVFAKFEIVYRLNLVTSF